MKINHPQGRTCPAPAGNYSTRKTFSA